MPKLYMLIGIPGSGKSTWQKNSKAAMTAYLASTDQFIELYASINHKTYDEVFKDIIKSAEKHMYEMVMTAVKNDGDIVWDQTNLNRKTRAKKLIMIPDYYEKIAVVFPVPDDLDKRLANRPGKTIPYHVMKNMIDSFEYPQMDEGFNVIVRADVMNEKLIEVLS